MQCTTAVFSAHYAVGFHLWSNTPSNFSRLKLPFEPRTVLFQQTITYATDVLFAENQLIRNVRGEGCTLVGFSPNPHSVKELAKPECGAS